MSSTPLDIQSAWRASPTLQIFRGRATLFGFIRKWLPNRARHPSSNARHRPPVGAQGREFKSGSAHEQLNNRRKVTKRASLVTVCSCATPVLRGSLRGIAGSPSACKRSRPFQVKAATGIGLLTTTGERGTLLRLAAQRGSTRPDSQHGDKRFRSKRRNRVVPVTFT
jgi:hypothetical protein